jgi:hypothetical protein
MKNIEQLLALPPARRPHGAGRGACRHDDRSGYGQDADHQQHARDVPKALDAPEVGECVSVHAIEDSDRSGPQTACGTDACLLSLGANSRRIEAPSVCHDADASLDEEVRANLPEGSRGGRPEPSPRMA